MSDPSVRPLSPYRTVLAGFLACLLVLVLLFGLWGAWKVFHRYQVRSDRAQARTQALYDAQNTVRVTAIQIRNQAQRVKVAKQQAQIRYQNSVGVRRAQDEIARTLTPLYVQFEMTEALKEIAHSGRNSSVIYLPSGANGIPLVSTTDPEKVGRP